MAGYDCRMTSPSTLLERSRDTIALHPRVPRALKAALAAVLAWLVVQPLGGAADEYPYYAPLGAVIAVSATVADSLRASLQSVFAILLGAGLAVAAGSVLSEVPAIAAVVLLGTLVAGWWRLGVNGSWVPISAIFVLIIGHASITDFVLAYVVLTGLGAGVGVGINAVLPPMPLVPGEREIAALRRSLAAQLDDLADALDQTEPLSHEDWLRRHHDVSSRTQSMSRVVVQTTEARRVNWRARRWRERADQQADHARALERLSLVVDDLAGLLTEVENADRSEVALGPQLRAPAARAMSAVARMLRDRDEDDEPSAECVEAADAAVEELAEAVTDRIRAGATDVLAAGAVVTALRQLVASL